MNSNRLTYTLRLAVELRNWLYAKAKKNDRSMNAEIIRILREHKEADEQEAKTA